MKKEIYGYSDDGFDGEDQVYKSVLYGYNDNALAKLQKYVIDGKFIPEEIKESAHNTNFISKSES